EAVYSVVKAAVEKARAGGGPTLIEAETYRMGAHSSSDDPTRYRDQKEVDVWKNRDQIDRLRNRLVTAKLWDDAREAALRAELLGQVNAAIEEAEKLPPPAATTLFDDLYDAEPWNITEQ